MPSSCSAMNFPAFHSLMVRLRLAVMRSSDRFRSWPAVVPATCASADQAPVLLVARWPGGSVLEGSFTVLDEVPAQQDTKAYPPAVTCPA